MVMQLTLPDQTEASTGGQEALVTPGSIRGAAVMGVRWTTVATLGPFLSQGITLVVLARLIAPTDFGVFNAAIVLIAASELLGQFGIGAALVQKEDLSSGHETAALVLSVGLGVLLFGAVSLPAEWWASFLGGRRLAPILQVLALSFPLAGLSSIPLSILQRDFRFKRLAVAELFAHVIGYGLVGVTLGVIGAGLWALVAAYLARWLLLAMALLLSRPLQFSRFHSSQMREILHYGGGLMLARATNYLALQGDNYVVSSRLGFASLGFYGRAYQLMALPASLIGQIADRVTFPILSRLQNDRARLEAFLERATGWAFTILAPSAVLAAFLSDWIVRIVLGPDWERAGPIFAVLCLGLPFRAGSKMPDSLLRATGLVYRRAALQGVYASAVIFGAIAGTKFGPIGVAWSVLGALVLNYIMMLWLGVWATGARLSSVLRAHGPGLAAAAFLFLSGFIYTRLSP